MAESTTTIATAAENLVTAMLKRTEYGYPVIAGLAFNPTTYDGEEPTNYASKETWSITSSDNLQLQAVHYTPQNSNDKWVIIIHGYGHNHKHMYPFTGPYLANGYNVLMVDERAAGDSEGTWLTMGTAESADIALWTQKIAEYNPNAKITLFGVSMGAATAMLTASRSDIVNVTSLVEDCGYAKVMDVITSLHENNILLKALINDEDFKDVDPAAKKLTGYYLSEASPLDSISSAKMPSLFITGSDDAVVSATMLSDLYDASGAEVKEKFIVDGAPHALAASLDPVGYNNTLFRFIAEADGEGWVTNNSVSSILLRGTKYDDNFTNSGSQVTINSAVGDDTITNSGSNVLFQYNSGDGNDLITGFDSTSTLSISGGSYISANIDDDLILNVGEDLITLQGAASLDNVNIIGTEYVPPTYPSVNIDNTIDATLINGTEYDDIVFNSGTRVTIDTFGGDDYIFNNVDSTVTTASLGNSINAGDGNDVVISHHSYNPTLLGGNGDDSIIVSRGHKTYIDGGNGNDSITGYLPDSYEHNWAMGGYATIYGGDGDDYINSGYSNDSSIDGGNGNDTIINNGENTTLNGGAGNNLIRLQLTEEHNTGETKQFVVLNGNTTVENFKTGFDDIADVVYIEGDSPGVDFKSGGLTLYYDNDSSKSLQFSDINSTAKLKLYYAANSTTGTQVFIADDEWYNVAEGTAQYYVGATAKMNHGIDYSEITSAVDVTLDTDYANPKATFWISNIYSIKGGAGLTTITGSDKSDTIISGDGSTTINAAAGDDLVIFGNSPEAVYKYSVGDGNDTVENFQDNFKLLIVGSEYTTTASDENDVLVKVDSGSILLKDAATLGSLNIETVITENELPGGTTTISGTSATLTADDKTIYVGKKGATLDGYTIDKSFVVDAATPNEFTDQISNKNFTFDERTFYAKNQQPIVLEDIDTSNGTFVKFQTADGKRTLLGWSPLTGGIVDGSDIDQKQILIGNAPNGDSTIRGGNKNDTIVAGKNDLVELSGGYDKIYLEDNAAINMADGSTVTRTEIVEGFDVEQNIIKIDSTDDIKARVLNGNLALDKGNSRYR